MEKEPDQEKAIISISTEKVYEFDGTLKQITNCFNVNSDRFHVKPSLEEWINTPNTSLETVVIDEVGFPKFEFNVKIYQQQKRRDIFIPSCAITRLKELHEFIKINKISYSPPNLVKFAFNYAESEHWLKSKEISKIKKKKFLYREPFDEHIAHFVVNSYYTAEDTLVDMADADLIYYFLSILKCINCKIINEALEKIHQKSTDANLYQSAIIPVNVKCSRQIKYYTLYAEAIHFLGLMSLPSNMGDTKGTIIEKIRNRNIEQTKILCDSLDISNYSITNRGQDWMKIVKFFEASPDFCNIVGTTILESSHDTNLTIIQKQTLDQVKELWMWRKMRDFHICYTFATNKHTEVHKIPEIAVQCKKVQLQYQNLIKQKEDKELVPFMSFYLKDAHLQKITNVECWPELFYAAVSSNIQIKKGNIGWEFFVATRPAYVPRRKIEELLSIKANVDDGDELKYLSTSKSESWRQEEVEYLDSAGYFPTHFQHFEDNMEIISNKCEEYTAWDTKNSELLGYNTPLDWDICELEGDNTLPQASGIFNLDYHMDEENNKLNQET